MPFVGSCSMRCWTTSLKARSLPRTHSGSAACAFLEKNFLRQDASGRQVAESDVLPDLRVRMRSERDEVVDEEFVDGGVGDPLGAQRDSPLMQYIRRLHCGAISCSNSNCRDIM